MIYPIDLNFHVNHSENIELTENNRIASRKSSFDNGLCALSKELQYNSNSSASDDINRFSFIVTRTDARWNGGLRLGVSSLNPSDASFASNVSSFKNGSVFEEVPQSALSEGTLVTAWIDLTFRALYYVTSNSKNNIADPVKVQLDDPELLDCIDGERTLWFYLHLYGFTVQVKIFGET